MHETTLENNRSFKLEFKISLLIHLIKSVTEFSYEYAPCTKMTGTCLDPCDNSLDLLRSRKSCSFCTNFFSNKSSPFFELSIAESTKDHPCSYQLQE